MIIRSITAPNPGPFTLDGTRTYLLGETAVLDPGPDDAGHIAKIREQQPRLELILITHRHGDHAPAAVPLKKATGARIIAPRGVPGDVDVIVEGGETIEIDGERVEVIATPGHTQEHVCYMTTEGDLFSGDTILGFGTTAIFPPDGNMADYLRSLAALRSKSPVRIHPAHGPTREDAVALIDEYIAHRLQREQQVIDVIAGGSSTVAAMRHAIYPDLDGRLHGAAEIQITAHLIKLRDEERVEGRDGSYRLMQRTS